MHFPFSKRNTCVLMILGCRKNFPPLRCVPAFSVRLLNMNWIDEGFMWLWWKFSKSHDCAAMRFWYMSYRRHTLSRRPPGILPDRFGLSACLGHYIFSSIEPFELHLYTSSFPGCRKVFGGPSWLLRLSSETTQNTDMAVANSFRIISTPAWEDAFCVHCPKT